VTPSCCRQPSRSWPSSTSPRPVNRDRGGQDS
jgi:hypothetical protein